MAEPKKKRPDAQQRVQPGYQSGELQEYIVPVGGARCGSCWPFQRRPRSGWVPDPDSFVGKTRLPELQRLIYSRHDRGTGIDWVDTEDGPAYLTIAASVIMDAAGISEWAENWTPLVDQAEVASIAATALQIRPRYTADEAADVLCVKDSEREALRLKTIGATDVRSIDRKAAQRTKEAEKKKLKRAEERRLSGGIDRAEYIAGSFAEQCRREGISRDTGYRRRKSAAKTAQTDLSDRLRPPLSLSNSAAGTCPILSDRETRSLLLSAAAARLASDRPPAGPESRSTSPSGISPPGL